MNRFPRSSHLIALMIVSAMTFTGCRPAAEPYTSSMTEPAFTPLPAPSLSPIITRTHEPTATRVKTAVSTITPTLLPETATQRALYDSANATWDYQRNVEFPATLEARGVECKEGFELELRLDVIRNSSDDWTMFTCSPILENAADWQTPGAVDFGSRYTQFIRTDHSQTWIVTHGDYEGMLYNRSQALVTADRWTSDGQYVYFYPSFYSAPSGFSTGALYTGIFSLALFQLNLNTGEVETVIPYNKSSHAYAISPNDRYLIYAQRIEPEIVHLVDLDTGEEKLIELDQGLAASGRFSWSPESAKVAFGAGYPKESDDWRDDISATSIYLLTIENLHLETILDRDPRIIIPQPWYSCDDQAWLDENRICVRIENDDLWGDYVLGLKSGSVVPFGTPTPTYLPKATLTPTP